MVDVQACCVERRPQVLPVLTETLRGTSGFRVGCIVGGRRSGLLCRKASPSLACVTETLRGTSGSTVGCIVGGRRSGMLCRKASPSLACADRDPEWDIRVYSWMYCWW